MRIHRAALTLVEVVVAIAIVGLLVVLLLPAVQAARESAKRSSCAANMRQIGLAIHSYTESNGAFPPFVLVWRVGTSRPGGPWDIHVTLLPYLERRDTYNALNLALHHTDDANRTVKAMSVGVYLCPSDERPHGALGAANVQFSAGSGQFMRGPDALIGPDKRGLRSDGFFTRSPARQNDVSDGMSQTAMMSELVHGANLNPEFGLPRPVFGLTDILDVSPPTQTQLIQNCDRINAGGPRPGGERSGTPWVLLAGYTHLFTPNKPSCEGKIIGGAYSPRTVSSRHKNGVNVAFGDGHVAFVGASVDSQIWSAIGSRDGGETIENKF
jgi:prepilin-type processing-associated H-X9-DG protein